MVGLLVPAAPATADGSVFQPAFRFDQVDLELTKQFRNGKESPVDRKALKRVLGFSRTGGYWGIGPWPKGLTTYRYLLVLKEPVAVGAMHASKAAKYSANGGVVSYLRPGVKGTPDPNDEKQWIRVQFEKQLGPRMYTFPPGTRTRAFLYTDVRGWVNSRITSWTFYKRRIFNATPRALGIAEVGPFGSWTNAIPAGQPWQNTAADMETGRIARAPVSDIAPSWYILSWEQDRTLCGAVFKSNATRFSLLSYHGRPDENPGVAPRRAWRKIHIVQNKGGWISFKPVRTRAIMVKILACQRGSQIARISAFHAFEDLGDAPVPPRKKPAAPPLTVKYDQPIDGETALVIDGPDGVRIRNLFAQVPRKKGPHEEAWDLRDDLGRRVMPGVYRWRAIAAPPFTMHYQMSPYPNVETYFKDRVPWDRGVSSPHGWMSDHCVNSSGASVGDRVYFGAPGCEGGVAFIECDRNGRKMWGRRAGQERMTSDDKALYLAVSGGTVLRMDPETRKTRKLLTYNRPNRRGWLTGMAARGGKLYLSFSGRRNYIYNATSAGNVDLDHCLPLHPKRVLEGGGETRVVPNPRLDFLRVLRMGRTPPGQIRSTAPNKPDRVFPVYLDSTFGASRHQHVVVAFKKPVRIGSLVFPHPGGKVKISFSVLKPDAPYPPDPRREQDWIPFESNGRKGWECIPAPRGTVTRALRIRFTGEGDELDDVAERFAESDEAEGAGMIRIDPGDALPTLGSTAADRASEGRWYGRLEGLKILGRRFRNLRHTAKIRVNSGVVNELGEWDAKRKKVIWTDSPAIYVMQWDKPQNVSGLAIKEIDAYKAEIDVWEGPEGAEVTLEGEDGWRHVATYRQKGRSGAQPSFYRNLEARYIDGYVDFHGPIKTRAVRMRIVEQRLDGSQGALRSDLAAGLDTRRCRVWGVAPLEDITGEIAGDDVWYQRLDVYDSNTGKLIREVRANVGHSIATDPSGRLYGIKDNKVVKIDVKTGKTTPFLIDMDNPHRMTIGPKGYFYVYVWRPTPLIRVYDPKGNFVRTIGHPGGLQPGWWDPMRFGYVECIFVDKNDSLWVVESEDYPRRIIQYKTDGTLVRELLGNTHYGGGGVLNRYDKTRAFYNRVQFELDWKTQAARVKSLLARRLDIAAGADLIPMRKNRRTYLVSAPAMHQAGIGFATVYIYDEKTGTARLAAAFGAARQFGPLRTGQIIQKLGGKVPAHFDFIWCDRNGNGKVDAAEVQFEPTDRNRSWLGRFDSDMGVTAGKVRWEVAEFLDNGVPIYVKKTLPFSASFRLNNGNYFSFAAREGGGERMVDKVVSPDGKRIWSYQVSHPGVSGLYVPPWRPGMVTNEFAIIGHEVADKGDLGEFFVVHSNTGSWRLWTADGMLAGQVMLHRSNPKARYLGPDTSAIGTRVDGLTAGQEHFHGFFTKTEADGKYYVITGGHYMCIVEVRGLDKFKRFEGKVVVTPEDFRRALRWEGERARKRIRGRAPIIHCGRMEAPPRIDGRRGKLEWPEHGSRFRADAGTVEFKMAYDDRNLYLFWQGTLGPIDNYGDQWRRYFKTGGCLDLFLATDPNADPKRSRPAAGDLRLLLTWRRGRPQAVLYQPVAPRAPEAEAWKTTTVAGGTTAFDRVVLLKDVRMARTASGNWFAVEAAVPLETLGLRIFDGMLVKADWGILTVDETKRVRQRLYWTNKVANGTTDEAIEARLEPHLWGYARFSVRGPEDPGSIDHAVDMMEELEDRKKSAAEEDAILSELEGD